MSTVDVGQAIVIRDRRKPNQYTTDNIIAREWLPVLRVGDAFFFYSIYLSMAHRETESSWSSLRTISQYLQCSIDLIIRGNKLLEICELIFIKTGNQCSSNEYYILDPPPLTDELKERIYRRLEDILAAETSKNWLAWAQQVEKALDKHESLPEIWSERRQRRGGRPVKTIRPENPARESQAGFSDQGACVSQAGFSDLGSCEPQAGWLWLTSRALVSHDQGDCEPQPKQEQGTRQTKQVDLKDQETFSLFVRKLCHSLGVAPQVADLLFESHTVEQIARQLEWLPFRNARDPAAMLVSAVQGDWTQPAQYQPERVREAWGEWLAKAGVTSIAELMSGDEPADTVPPPAETESPAELPEDDFSLSGTGLDGRDVWGDALVELRMQMTQATFDTWLHGSEVVGVHDGTLVVRVRDEYAVDWLQGRWIKPILRTLSGVVGRPVEVRFVVE